ncbi:MAG: hypothetical protein M3Z27_01170 [Actinomycetota bacterium]|nr:hypothetical protein [Actinomycetota bacterium]
MNRPTTLRALTTAVACGAVGVAAGIAGAAAAPTHHGSTVRRNAAASLTAPPHMRPPGGGPAVHEDAVVLDKAGTGFITATIDNGVVKSLSGDSLTITEGFGNVTYKTVTLTIPTNATVIRNFNKATLSDLKTGDHVHVAQSSEGTTVFADDGTQRPPHGGQGHFGPRGPGGPGFGGPGFGDGGPPPMGG